jgi:hypothetical protein
MAAKYKYKTVVSQNKQCQVLLLGRFRPILQPYDNLVCPFTMVYKFVYEFARHMDKFAYA